MVLLPAVKCKALTGDEMLHYSLLQEGQRLYYKAANVVRCKAPSLHDFMSLCKNRV